MGTTRGLRELERLIAAADPGRARPALLSVAEPRRAHRESVRSGSRVAPTATAHGEPNSLRRGRSRVLSKSGGYCAFLAPVAIEYRARSHVDEPRLGLRSQI